MVRRRAPTGRRGRWSWLAAAVLVTVAAVALVWFQPQKLLYDHSVDEAPPDLGAEQSQPIGPGPPVTAGQPVELGGSFISREHETQGDVRVLQLSDGRVVIRFEDFATSNGPVLVVWLSKGAANAPADALDDDHVSLGPLTGNIGDQNYPVPADVDAFAYTSVVVWCDRFDVPFGAADLGRPR